MKQKGFAPILAVVIIIIVFVAALASYKKFFATRMSEPKSYSSQKYNFSLEYPSNLIMNDVEAGDYYRYIFSLKTDDKTNACNGVLSLFYLENPKNITLESFLDEFNKGLLGQYPIDYKNGESVSIGGEKAYFVEELCEPCAGYCGVYYIGRDKKIYGLTIRKTRQELDSILSTFKFIQ